MKILTAKLFYDTPYAKEFDAELLSQSEHDGKFHIILDRTLFYPGGGGQPCDTGTLDGSEVLEVIEHGEEIIHITASPVEGEKIREHAAAFRGTPFRGRVVESPSHSHGANANRGRQCFD